MEVTYATKAIVLKIEPWNDVDSKVSFYTQEKGKLDLIARGTKKISSKLVGHLQPLNLVDLMVINGKRVGYAGAVVSLECYPQIKQDLDKLKVAVQSFNLINRLIKIDEPDPEIFNLIKQFLNILEQIKAESVFYDFLAKASLLQLVCLLGYQPDINISKSEINFLSHYSIIGNISNNCLKNLKLIINNDLLSAIKYSKLERQTLNEVNEVIEKLLVLVLEK